MWVGIWYWLVVVYFFGCVCGEVVVLGVGFE